jgi:hypothetical protein
MKRLLFIVLAVLGVAPVNAQQQLQALIVAACGTPPVSYVAGTYGILTMDTTGKLCDSGSGGGGGTVTANQGTAGSSAWLVTGTGGTFPVTGTFWPYTLGQQLAAGSVPVVLTAAQLSTLTPPPAITGFATQTTLAAILAAQGAAPAQQTGATVGVVAGSAIIGKVGIDQTTPGTTNGVVQNAGPSNVTATDCSGTVTSGGTAQNAFTAQTALHGFTIANIDTTEPLWISFTTTAAASGAGSYPLPAATVTTFAGFGSFTAPPGFGLNHALSVIAATTNHKFTCTWW